MRCTSCNINLITEENYARFKCPVCMKAEIVRCENCRRSSNIYICPECGFEGP
ncbi:MAG: zinc finger domain-containing protein [Candidatus Aenigmatarchaeota archaeon]